VGRHNCFGFERGFMNGAVREIDNLFRMAERETRIAPLMAGVCGGGGVALLQCRGHVAVAEITHEAAPAGHQQFPVPVPAGRQPHLALDV